MIRYGPAGIPLSCKGRTLRDGIADVHNLTLSALEIQMVRPKAVLIPPDEDTDVGKTIKELTADAGFIVGIDRDGDTIFDTDEPIQEDDNLVLMPTSIAPCFNDLYDLGVMAERLDVSLSLHTPYYMDLGGDDQLTADCLESLRHAAIILNALKGRMVVTNVGLYPADRERKDVDEAIAENLKLLMKWWKKSKLTPKLGIEVTGQQDVWGSLEQVLDLCDSIKGLLPVLNFPHYHSRTKGSLQQASDFADLIEQFQPYYKNNESVYTDFSGVEYDADGNERRLTPIKRGDLRFEPLAEALCDLKPELTIISSSPLLEHDAMYMQIITERILSKRVAKELKERKKTAATNAE
ncbi:MAG: endonuclease IV [Candidatus Methanomethylophilus sp.]|nr:endonuclease IV [Methanomethylophilus sp.]MDD4669110.1 endonuclease IV [Methanomethylophilus sp.]